MTSQLKKEETFQWIEVLKKVTLFESLKTNDEALGHLASLMITETHKTNHTLITEGELGDKFYILLNGQVSIHKTTPEGDGYKVVILKSEFRPALGEGGIIEAEPRSATVICDTECEFLVLSRERFQTFSKEFPQWSIPIMTSLFKTLMGRVRKLNNDLMLLHKALTTEIRGH
jgi:CRP-like cAMP-binding protein